MKKRGLHSELIPLCHGEVEYVHDHPPIDKSQGSKSFLVCLNPTLGCCQCLCHVVFGAALQIQMFKMLHLTSHCCEHAIHVHFVLKTATYDVLCACCKSISPLHCGLGVG